MQGLSTGTIAQLMQGLPAAPPYFYQIMGACALQPAPSREAQRPGCDSLRPFVCMRAGMKAVASKGQNANAGQAKRFR